MTQDLPSKSGSRDQGIARWLREPLFHFILLGIGLFVLFSWVQQGGEQEDDRPTIVVSAGQVDQLIQVYRKIWQRDPDEVELQKLIDNFVLEEIYYRQAIAMGLDRDDTIIRRRLRQKLEFLTEDLASLENPTDEDLLQFRDQFPDRFREPSTFTFEQRYFNPEKHGEEPLVAIEALKESLNQGEDIAGDSALVPIRFEDADTRQIDSQLGVGFAEKIGELRPGGWEGPFSSGLGYHLVRIEEVREGELAPLEEIRDIVAREWTSDQRNTLRADLDASMRQQYQVIIEGADGDSGQASTNQREEP